jgi:hypothetical protein
MMCSFAATLTSAERKTLLDLLAKMRRHVMENVRKAMATPAESKS